MSASSGGWSRAQRVGLVLALLLGMLRLGTVVLHAPLAGYANQFDMLRTTGCLNLQPDADLPAGAATPQAPITHYRTGAPANASCLWSSEAALAAAVVAIDQAADAVGWGEPDRISLRLFALIKALLLICALGWLQHALRSVPRLALAHAWGVALVLLDPFNTLYLASFYTEYTALLGAWLALLLPLVWLQRATPPKPSALLGWGACLALLLGARFAHVLLPFALLGAFALIAWRRRWPLAPSLLWPLLLLLPVLALQLHEQRAQPAIRQANTMNSLFGAAMPAVSDASAFVSKLGLPARCAQLVHTSWYLKRGRDVQTECPQALELSRLRWTLALEPAAWARLIARGVLLSGQWRPSYLGELAGTEFQRLPAGPLGLGLSLSDAVARLPFWALLAFWIVPVLTPLLGWRASAGEHWLYGMLASLVALGWLVALVGDGYSELARHLHLAANAACVCWLLLAWRLLRWLRSGARAPGPLQRYVLALTLGLALGALAWLQQQALAFGVLDTPAAESIEGDRVDLAGWAIDPRGVRAVDVVHADGRRETLMLAPYPVLSGIFGAGVGASSVHYTGTIRLSASADGAFAIEVVPNRGAATVIDRRWMRAH